MPEKQTLIAPSSAENKKKENPNFEFSQALELLQQLEKTLTNINSDSPSKEDAYTLLESIQKLHNLGQTAQIRKHNFDFEQAPFDVFSIFIKTFILIFKTQEFEPADAWKSFNKYRREFLNLFILNNKTKFKVQHADLITKLIQTTKGVDRLDLTISHFQRLDRDLSKVLTQFFVDNEYIEALDNAEDYYQSEEAEKANWDSYKSKKARLKLYIDFFNQKSNPPENRILAFFNIMRLEAIAPDDLDHMLSFNQEDVWEIAQNRNLLNRFLKLIFIPAKIKKEILLIIDQLFQENKGTPQLALLAISGALDSDLQKPEFYLNFLFDLPDKKFLDLILYRYEIIDQSELNSFYLETILWAFRKEDIDLVRQLLEKDFFKLLDFKQFIDMGILLTTFNDQSLMTLFLEKITQQNLKTLTTRPLLMNFEARDWDSFNIKRFHAFTVEVLKFFGLSQEEAEKLKTDFINAQQYYNKDDKKIDTDEVTAKALYHNLFQLLSLQHEWYKLEQKKQKKLEEKQSKKQTNKTLSNEPQDTNLMFSPESNPNFIQAFSNNKQETKILDLNSSDHLKKLHSNPLQLALKSGIRVFSRFYIRTIINNIFATHGQNLETKNLVGRETILFFSAINDNNGALSDPYSMDQIIKAVKEQTDGTVDVIIICGPWSSLHRIIAWQRRLRKNPAQRYTEQRPWIRQIVINQHGTEDDMHADRSGHYKYIDQDLIFRWQSKWQKKGLKTNPDLMPNGRITLLSCSTAALRYDKTGKRILAVADYMADATQLPTTGPVESSSATLKVLTDNQQETFLHPTYAHSKREKGKLKTIPVPARTAIPRNIQISV